MSKERVAVALLGSLWLIAAPAYAAAPAHGDARAAGAPHTGHKSGNVGPWKSVVHSPPPAGGLPSTPALPGFTPKAGAAVSPMGHAPTNPSGALHAGSGSLVLSGSLMPHKSQPLAILGGSPQIGRTRSVAVNGTGMTRKR